MNPQQSWSNTRPVLQSPTAPIWMTLHTLNAALDKMFVHAAKGERSPATEAYGTQIMKFAQGTEREQHGKIHLVSLHGSVLAGMRAIHGGRRRHHCWIAQ